MTNHWKLPGKDLVDPCVEQCQSLLLIGKCLFEVKLLQNVDIEGEEATHRQAFLDKLLHSQFWDLHGGQNGPPTREMICWTH